MVNENPELGQNPNPAETKTTSRIMTKSFGVICLLILLVLLLGGYFVVNEASRSKAIAPTTTPIAAMETASPSASPLASETPAPELKTYTSAKFANTSFSGYSLKHPTDWIETSERNDNVGTGKLTLTKGAYKITIQQGPMGGSQCVYKDSEVPNGQEAIFVDKRGKPYIDIVAKVGNLRRNEESGGYAFCQESKDSPGSYGTFTTVGVLDYSGPTTFDQAILGEMDSIVKSIQVLP